MSRTLAMAIVHVPLQMVFTRKVLCTLQLSNDTSYATRFRLSFADACRSSGVDPSL